MFSYSDECRTKNKAFEYVAAFSCCGIVSLFTLYAQIGKPPLTF